MTHKHYDHYSGEMIRRLDGFFGAVDARMNERIEGWIAGKSVLDVGCGFGQLVEHLRKKGYSSTGIDQLGSQITAGKERFADADLRLSEGDLDFDDQSVDTIILKDTLHHILDESDVHRLFTRLARICRKRLIIMDPNPSPIVLSARKLIGHQDPVCRPRTARMILRKNGFNIIHETYTDVVAFPLSGGFVGRPFINNRSWYAGILSLDEMLEKFSRLFDLQSLVCWRYMLVGERSEEGVKTRRTNGSRFAGSEGKACLEVRP